MKRKIGLVLLVLVLVLLIGAQPLSALVGLNAPLFGDPFGTEAAARAGAWEDFYRDWFSNDVKRTLVTVGPLTIGVFEYEDGTGMFVNSGGRGVAYVFDCDPSAEGTVTIPSIVNGWPVTDIYRYAFSDCTKVINVVIPDTVKTIYDEAFGGVLNITYSNNMTAPPHPYSKNWGAKYVNAPCDDYFVYADSNKTQLIACVRSATDVVIPNGVKSIVNVLGKEAFAYNKNLTSIVIPDSVTSIDKNTFSGCIGLKSVTLGNGITGIEEGTFRNCSALTNIKLPDTLESIGSEAFCGCSGLKNVALGTGLTRIESYAFRDCSALTSIVLPDALESIGRLAFGSCYSLTEIKISDNVKEIGLNAFISTGYYRDDENWKNGFLYLESYLLYCEYFLSGNVIVKNGTKLIADNAFDSTRATSITLPNSVKYIGKEAFADGNNLTSVIMPESIISIEERILDGSRKATIHCYKNSYAHQYAVDNGIPFVLIDDSHVHSFASAVTTEATCTESGVMTYTCTCGYSYTEGIPSKGGHTWSAWVSKTEPDADKDGVDERTCAVCHVVESRTVKALVDTETGVKVLYSTEFTDGTTLDVSEVSDETAFRLIGETYSGTFDTKIFNITPVRDGVPVQPTGTVTVKIPVSENFGGGKITVVYVDTEKGTTETVPCTVVGGYVVFNVTHFSKYALVCEKGNVQTVSIGDMEIQYKKTASFNPVIRTEGEVGYTVTYTSSNPKVVTVDPNGNMKTVRKGTATITCTVTDENGNSVQDTCTVKVKFVWWQWILWILLFGWIWY